MKNNGAHRAARKANDRNRGARITDRRATLATSKIHVTVMFLYSE
jgi:hypothetical protein